MASTQSPSTDINLFGLDSLQAEVACYLRELPRLLAEGNEDRFVLIKGDQVVSLWDTFSDAYQAGRERFGWGECFLAQPIEAKYLNYPWPEALLPRKAV